MKTIIGIHSLLLPLQKNMEQFDEYYDCIKLGAIERTKDIIDMISADILRLEGDYKSAALLSSIKAKLILVLENDKK